MILIDTGPLVAMIDKKDAHYPSVARFLLGTNQTFSTTEACLTEAVYLINKATGISGVRLLHQSIMTGVLHILPSGQAQSDRTFGYMMRFHDQPCDYADATLLVAAEETGLRQIFTIDPHFYAYRLSSGDSLEVVA